MIQYVRLVMTALLITFLGACAQEGGGLWGVTPPAASPAADTAVEGACPPGMILITPPEEDSLLGEGDPEKLVDAHGGAYQYPLREGRMVPSEAYCLAQFPFPGEGEQWAAEAAYFELMPELEVRLAKSGRRLCSVSELHFAAAGPKNWRLPIDPERRVDGCEPNDHSPDRPIGGWTECVSPTGAHDFTVRSSWAKVEAWERPHLVASGIPEGELLPYAVYGGTAREDTFYPPSNHALHFHCAGLMEGGGYKDDDLRVCADPWSINPEEEAEWEQSRMAFVEVGSTYRAWLGVGL